MTIGAGNRATVDDLLAGVALAPETGFEEGTAAQAYVRRAGAPPRGEVLHLGIASVRRLNDALLYGARPGALGSSLGAAGRRAAVVGNADMPSPTGGSNPDLHREAALAVMDDLGRVPGGAVDQTLLAPDAEAPFGLAMAEDATVLAFDAAWAANHVVLVELSDLERLDAYGELALPAARRAGRAEAVRRADDLLARLLAKVDLRQDLVLVVAPAAPRDTEQLTVAAMAGPGVRPGWARSATTRRDGYVTLSDVAPTVLHRLGVEVPAEMTGTPVVSAGGGRPEPSSFHRLAELNRVALFRDRATVPLTVAFIAFQVLVYGLAAVALTWPARRLTPVVAFLTLVILAVPSVAFLAGLFRTEGLGVAGLVVAVFASAAVLAAAALAAADLGAAALATAGLGAWAGGRARLLVAPVLLVGLVLAVLVVDVLAGGRLQINTVFGYSPIVAGRFAGFGNLAFALVAMSAIVVATAVWAWARLTGRSARPALAVAAGLLALTVVVDGHPALGSDVGGVLATVPAFAVTLLLLAQVPLDWRRVGVIAVTTMVVVSLFAAVDLSRPPEARTHLGRLVATTADSGAEGLMTVVERKLSANVSILSTSVWTYGIPVALAFLAFLTWRRQGVLGVLQERVPGLRACLVGGLVAGLLGLALNDSGVAVPAMMLAVLLPYVTFLALGAAAEWTGDGTGG